MSTSIATTTKMSEDLQSQTSRYQQLQQRKEALEKKLNEKYEQLHQICQKEATLIGNNLDLISTHSGATTSQSTLRKKVGSSFRVPDYQIFNDEEINKLLLQRQMQQQISQASFRIANDPLQSKSIRRTHKQTYDGSQQKISQINESISLIQRHQQSTTRPLSQDDIDLHRCENRFVKNTLAMVGNNPKNLHILNASNLMSERRSSMKSTTSSLGSSNTFIVQPSPSSASSLTSLKTLPNNNINGNMGSPRGRHDTRFDYEFHQQKNESPTPSNFSLQNPQNVNHQIPLCSQSLKNIKINSDNQSISSQDYYNNNMNQHNQYFNTSNSHHQLLSPLSPPSSNRILHQSENKFIHRLHSFHQQYQHEMQQQQQQDDSMRIRQLQKAQTLNNNHHSPNHYTPAHSAGLGGYWTINQNNQRVWISDNKYPLSPPPPTNMSKKSNSLGNFEFMHKHDNEQQHDSVSISSGNSNENKKKEKVWSETSLDVDPPKQLYRPRVDSPTTTSTTVVDHINNNHQVYENMQSSPSSKSIQQQIMSQHFQQQQQQQQNNYPSMTSNGHQFKSIHHSENIYLNPLANANSTNHHHHHPPNIPPKSKLRYSESTRSSISNRDIENNILAHMQHTPPILQVESPKNVTIIQEGSWKPYKEEIKSYEISDFYKYSQKYRQQQSSQQKQNADC
ncbi:CLUMA_CG009351, isoform A [Clunio marinus]|uniref:CLUMA_CG009351, isoform A n=1 Tax=Clunio marinus TaxID=568069 RepID=A0A1J1IBU0_9DIPT|nr:CLUMA_CG009351, isoform A [Clunio marinus]